MFKLFKGMTKLHDMNYVWIVYLPKFSSVKGIKFSKVHHVTLTFPVGFHCIISIYIINSSSPTYFAKGQVESPCVTKTNEE